MQSYWLNGWNSLPTGKGYKIIPRSEVPTDRSFRNAWTVDDKELTDGVGDWVLLKQTCLKPKKFIKQISEWLDDLN